MTTTDSIDETEFEWIAEETDYCLSYNAHPIARCLIEDNLKSCPFSEENE